MIYYSIVYILRERGSAPKRGRHTTICFSTKCICAVAAWCFDNPYQQAGAGFLGAPPVSLRYRRLWKKHSFRREDPWEDRPSECQIMGWRAVSASGLQGKGSPERSASFTGPSKTAAETPLQHLSWCFSSWFSQGSSSREECFFSHRDWYLRLWFLHLNGRWACILRLWRVWISEGLTQADS